MATVTRSSAVQDRLCDKNAHRETCVDAYACRCHRDKTLANDLQPAQQSKSTAAMHITHYTPLEEAIGINEVQFILYYRFRSILLTETV